MNKNIEIDDFEKESFKSYIGDEAKNLLTENEVVRNLFKVYIHQVLREVLPKKPILPQGGKPVNLAWQVFSVIETTREISNPEILQHNFIYKVITRGVHLVSNRKVSLVYMPRVYELIIEAWNKLVPLDKEGNVKSGFDFDKAFNKFFEETILGKIVMEEKFNDFFYQDMT